MSSSSLVSPASPTHVVKSGARTTYPTNPLLVNDYMVAQAKVDQLRARLAEAESRLDAESSSRAAQIGMELPNPWFSENAPAGTGMATQLSAPLTQIKEHVLGMASSTDGSGAQEADAAVPSFLSCEFYW